MIYNTIIFENKNTNYISYIIGVVKDGNIVDFSELDLALDKEYDIFMDSNAIALVEIEEDDDLYDSKVIIKGSFSITDNDGNNINFSNLPTYELLKLCNELVKNPENYK